MTPLIEDANIYDKRETPSSIIRCESVTLILNLCNINHVKPFTESGFIHVCVAGL